MKTLLTALFIPLSLVAANVPIGWDYDNPQTLRGFTVHIGTNAGQYTTSIAVGLTQTASIATLAKTNYVAVSAQSTNGLNSDLSVPLIIVLPDAPKNVRILSQLQASEMIDGPWINVTNLADFVEPTSKRKFYRVRMLAKLE